MQKAVSQFEKLLLCTVLFPGLPDFRTVSNSNLFSISHDRCPHQLGIVKHLVFFRNGIIHIFHKCDIRMFSVPVDQVFYTADPPYDCVKLFSRQTKPKQVHHLVLNTPFFKITFCLLRIKTLALSKNLNVQ